MGVGEVGLGGAEGAQSVLPLSRRRPEGVTTQSPAAITWISDTRKEVLMLTALSVRCDEQAVPVTGSGPVLAPRGMM